MFRPFSQLQNILLLGWSLYGAGACLPNQGNGIGWFETEFHKQFGCNGACPANKSGINTLKSFSDSGNGELAATEAATKIVSSTTTAIRPESAIINQQTDTWPEPVLFGEIQTQNIRRMWFYNNNIKGLRG